MTWRVLPDCVAFLLEHDLRDGSTQRVIVGPRSIYADADPTNRVRTRITPLPMGAFPFPMSEIVDDRIDPEAIGPLRQRPIPSLASAALALLRPTTTVEQMASDLGVSSRHLRTLFLDYVGLSPKRALRVARFRAVFAASQASPDTTWSRLAAMHGYCDQSHLVDEFHALVGESPEAFRARCEREAAESVPLLPSAGGVSYDIVGLCIASSSHRPCGSNSTAASSRISTTSYINARDSGTIPRRRPSPLSSRTPKR